MEVTGSHHKWELIGIEGKSRGEKNIFWTTFKKSIVLKHIYNKY